MRAAKLKVVPKLVKIDIGCGLRPKEGFTGWDMSSDAKADLVIDVRKGPWPLEDKSVDEVYSSHFLEHLTGPERMAFMDELYRVMKVGAKATFIFPYAMHRRAFQDPTHAWPPLVEESFLYFSRKARKDMMVDHYPIKCDFDFTYGYALDSEVSLRSTEYQQFAVKHYVNSCLDLQVVMTRRSDEKN